MCTQYEIICCGEDEVDWFYKEASIAQCNFNHDMETLVYFIIILVSLNALDVDSLKRIAIPERFLH